MFQKHDTKRLQCEYENYKLASFCLIGIRGKKANKRTHVKHRLPVPAMLRVM